ncbi:MAG: SAM-dependent methyltransferase [Ruminococcus flavefaciens]|nr:SAM-dependent methyltransferase [Ruminococcus flavefaciens]
MAFILENVVPWGRNITEYRDMFMLSDDDMKKKIAGFGDGPASFNFQATEQGYSVTSFDPVYQFSKQMLEKRIEEVRKIVMKQMSENMDNYIWTNIKSLDELENIRMSAMKLFLNDFEKGKADGRYICHELPDKINADDNSFDIGLSSHFLLIYTSLGFDFHIKSITEMLRVCRQIRIFPIVDLDAEKTDLISDVMNYFSKEYSLKLVETNYEFQKGDNKMLIIDK